MSERRGRASRFNRELGVELPVAAPNGAGGRTKSWAAADPATSWAEMLPIRGGEALDHALLYSSETWKVSMRWRPDVNTTCRLVYEGRPLDIKTCVDPDGRREELVMTCDSGKRT